MWVGMAGVLQAAALAAVVQQLQVLSIGWSNVLYGQQQQG
jgi:hypothetical protein